MYTFKYGPYAARTLVVFALIFLMTWPIFGHARSKKNVRTIPYSGQMVGAQGESVSGIFHLKFAFHRNEASTRAVWKETHEVAVVEGTYLMQLGERNPIPKSFKLEKLFVSVSLVGGPEIMREALAPHLAQPIKAAPAPTAKSAGKVSQPATPAVAGKPSGVVGYADKAGFAIAAEHALSSDKLEGKSLEEITDGILKTSKRRKVRIGAGRKFGGHIGGHGGGAYEEMCPRGFVVIGARGSSGMYIDGLQFICAPLEIE